MEQCGNEMKMLVVEEDADLLYKEYKVAVNLKNVAGVTSDDGDYRPKLGFHGHFFVIIFLNVVN